MLNYIEPGRWGAWDRFLETTPATGFMQTSWWTDFRATAGFGHFGTMVTAGSEIVGGVIVQRFSLDAKTCFYYMQDGPVVPDDDEAASDVFASIMSSVECQVAMEPQTVSHLRIEPRWQRLPAWVTGFRRPAAIAGYFEPRNTLCVDLRPAEDEIMAQMKPKGRYNIRVAARSGVTLVEDASPAGVRDFIRIHEDTAYRQGFLPKPPDYFTDLIALLTKTGHGSVYFAEYLGVRLACAIAVFFGDRATYFFGGSLLQHRHVMAPYLLHWELMRTAKARGHAWYDFWGVAPPGAADDDAWNGISAFKRKFGGTEVQLVATLDRVFDQRAYSRFAADGADGGGARRANSRGHRRSA